MTIELSLEDDFDIASIFSAAVRYRFIAVVEKLWFVIFTFVKRMWSKALKETRSGTRLVFREFLGE